MNRAAAGVLSMLALFGAGCEPRRAAPPSRFPDAAAALARMRASQACSRGVSAESKLDYLGSVAHVKGSVLLLAAEPDRIRFDVFSPFGATLTTVTTDGRRFALADLRQRAFVRGVANTCNLQRFTQVPLPPHGFVELLRGVAPVLVHEPGAAAIEWDGESYRIHILSKHQAEEEIRLVPADADWNLPWEAQRVRVTKVAVRQAGIPLYRVELGAHRAVGTAKAAVDPDGIDPPVPPSGPECHAELPARLRFVVADGAHAVELVSRVLAHNPPLVPGAFEQQPAPGLRVQESACD